MEIDADPGLGDLRQTAMRLWRRRWWIVGSIVVLVLVSVTKSARATEMYRSRTSVRQADPNSFVVFQTQSLSAPDPERAAATQVQLVQSDAVEQLVRDELGDAARGIADLRVTSVGDTDILSIVVKSARPEVARDAADAYAKAYLQVSQAIQVSALEQQAEELTAFNVQNLDRILELGSEIAQLDAEIAAAGPVNSLGSEEEKARVDRLRSERQLAETRRSSLVVSSETLEQRVVQLQVEANARRDIAGQVLRPAELASDPVTPRPLRDAALYALVGALLGLVLAWLRDVFGGRLRDVESVTHVAPGVPVLGAPLQLKVARRGPASDAVITLGGSGDTAAVEAYRALRTAVQTATDGSTLLVTSPGPREGKSHTVANLAGTLATAGASVGAVCIDFHQPNLHELFSQSNDVGLTSVLLGQRTLEETLIPIQVGAGDLKLLPAGPLPPNAAELLGSGAVGALLGELGVMFDYVLLDAPPILSVTDPIVASRWADHVLLVVGAGRTTSRSLHVALERLRAAEVEPLGIVFNGASRSATSAYHYGGYGSDAGRDERIPVAAWERVVRGGPERDATTFTTAASLQPEGSPGSR